MKTARKKLAAQTLGDHGIMAHDTNSTGHQAFTYATWLRKWLYT
jgi:hypothetical protein